MILMPRLGTGNLIFYQWTNGSMWGLVVGRTVSLHGIPEPTAGGEGIDQWPSEHSVRPAPGGNQLSDDG